MFISMSISASICVFAFALEIAVSSLLCRICFHVDMHMHACNCVRIDARTRIHVCNCFRRAVWVTCPFAFMYISVLMLANASVVVDCALYLGLYLYVLLAFVYCSIVFQFICIFVYVLHSCRSGYGSISTLTCSYIRICVYCLSVQQYVRTFVYL